MSNRQLGDPAYVGKPTTSKAANRFRLVLIVIILAGFIKAGLREGWFDFIAKLMP